MTPRRFYSFQQSGREADIHIFGEIVSEKYLEQDVSANSLSKQLSAVDADVINVYIDSPGGSVPEGWAIYNQLKQHRARVITYGIGFVASAALYPFLAGDERYAVEPSAYFLHQVEIGAFGNADSLRDVADAADQMTEIGLAPFVQAGVDPDAVREMMRKETWLSPAAALDCGIATGVITRRDNEGMTQSAKALIIQRMLLPAQAAPPPPSAADPPAGPVPPEEPYPPEPVNQTPTIMEMLGGMFKN